MGWAGLGRRHHLRDDEPGDLGSLGLFAPRGSGGLEGGAEHVCVPPGTVTAQPHSPVPLRASASPFPGTNLLLGEGAGFSLSLVHVQVSPPGACGVPPMPDSLGTEPAHLTEPEGGTMRSLWLLWEGGFTGGRIIRAAHPVF